MNENPEPVQPEAPSEPVQPEVPSEPVQPVAPAVPEQSQPISEPTTPVAEPVAGAATSTGTEPKKKTGIIIAVVAFALVALGCAVAAIMMLSPFGGGQNDRVPKALAALFSEGAPTNVEMKGKVTVYRNSDINKTSTEIESEDVDLDSIPISSLSIDFDTKANSTHGANTTEADVTVVFTDETEFSFGVSEIYTKDGDLYLKLSGLSDGINNYINNNTSIITDCATDDDDYITDCEGIENSPYVYFALLSEFGIIDVIDDEWILIPNSSFSTVEEMTKIEAPTQCLIDAFGTVDEYSDDIVKDYNNNPFITYSTEDLAITKKNNSLYKLGIDTEKFAGFINGMGNFGLANEINACLDEVAINTNIKASELTEMVNALPVTYVEIDDNNMFTRVYLKKVSTDGTMTAEADIDLSYPTAFNIEEPIDYIDLNDLITEVLDTFYGGMIEG